MGKNSRKRQRTEQSDQAEIQPLGARASITDDASKDDEERRLESLLFGIPFVPSEKGKGNKNVLVVSDDEDEPERGTASGSKELENLLDTDVSCSSPLLARATELTLRIVILYG